MNSNSFAAALLGLTLTAGLCFSTPVQAQGGNMGAGGYNGDFGSDYGVGLSQKVAGREAMAVAPFRSRTNIGTEVPWLGLRFGEQLSERLGPLLGGAPSSARIAQALAASGVRNRDVGCPALTDNLLKLPAVAALRANADWKKRAICLVLGDITVAGITPGDSPAEQAKELLQSGTVITVHLCALRNRDRFVVAASHMVTLQAPGRDYAQLAPRVALALLDDVGIVLTDDERIGLVHDASPLLASASGGRLRTEVRLGNAEAEAIDCRLLLRGKGTAERLRRALIDGRGAQRELRALLGVPYGATIRDDGAFARMHNSASHWLDYTDSVVRALGVRLRH